MATGAALPRHDARVLALKAGLLTIWAGVTFVLPFFARDLDFSFAGWHFSYWMGAQGAVLVFIAIIAVYAAAMRRLVPEDNLPPTGIAPDA